MSFTSDDLAALKAQLVVDEGLRLKPYVDTVGKITIGVGHNLTDKGITPAQADAMLDEDIAEAMNDVLDSLPWAVDLDAPRLQVLVNICFNTGLGGFLKFHQTLTAVRNKQYDLAAEAILHSRLAPNRAKRLAALMRTP